MDTVQRAGLKCIERQNKTQYYSFDLPLNQERNGWIGSLHFVCLLSPPRICWLLSSWDEISWVSLVVKVGPLVATVAPGLHQCPASPHTCSTPPPTHQTPAELHLITVRFYLDTGRPSQHHGCRWNGVLRYLGTYLQHLHIEIEMCNIIPIKSQKTDETFLAKIITIGVKYCHQPSKRHFSRDFEGKR